MAAQSMMADAGIGGLVVTEVKAPAAVADRNSGMVTSVATCPAGTQLIGGDWGMLVVDPNGGSFLWNVVNDSLFGTNQYTVSTQVVAAPTDDYSILVEATAFCGQLTFPMNMGMVGGELLDINTVSLLVGAIGTNPIITALVGITIAGVAGQAVWFVHRRRKK